MTPRDIAAIMFLVAVGSAGMLMLCALDTWVNSFAGNGRMYGKTYKRKVK